MKELNDLDRKFEEIEKDIRSAIADMHEAEKHIAALPWILAMTIAITLAVGSFFLTLAFMHLR